MTWPVSGSRRLRLPLDAHDVEVPGRAGRRARVAAARVSPVRSPQRVHQREERDRLPPPRGVRVQAVPRRRRTPRSRAWLSR